MGKEGVDVYELTQGCSKTLAVNEEGLMRGNRKP